MRNTYKPAYAERPSYTVTLQLVVFAILAVIVPMVVSDYFAARDELTQLQNTSQSQVAVRQQ